MISNSVQVNSIGYGNFGAVPLIAPTPGNFGAVPQVNGLYLVYIRGWNASTTKSQTLHRI